MFYGPSMHFYFYHLYVVRVNLGIFYFLKVTIMVKTALLFEPTHQKNCLKSFLPGVTTVISYIWTLASVLKFCVYKAVYKLKVLYFLDSKRQWC